MSRYALGIGPPGEWFPLNPDFKKDPPETGLYCCRCQRKVEKSYRSVEVNWDTVGVRNDPLGKDYIGNDCWKTITNGKPN